jgi:hypothetical protein
VAQGVCSYDGILQRVFIAGKDRASPTCIERRGIIRLEHIDAPVQRSGVAQLT